MGIEKILHVFAGAGARLAEDEGIILQFPGLDLLAAQQLVPGRRNENVRVGREGLRPRGELLRRPAHHGQFDLLVSQQRHKLLPVAAYLEPHVDPRMILAEARQ